MARYADLSVLCNIFFAIQLSASPPIGPIPAFPPATTSTTPSNSACVTNYDEIICRGVTGEFSPVTSYVSGQTYRLTCQDCSLENISQTSFPPQYSNLRIESFNVTRSAIDNIAPYTFSTLTWCRVLDLSHNRLTRISSTALAGEQIDTISLGHNSISEVPAEVFSDKLLALSLNDNSINRLHYDSFKGLRSLLYLELQNNEICSLPLGVFRSMRDLRELNLSGNRLAALPLGTFSGLISLTELRLARNALRYFKGTELLPLHRIAELDISGNKIAHLEPFNVWANGPTLRRVHIEGNLFACGRLIETVQFFKLKGVDIVTENGRYDVQNVDGVPCTEAERANITASEFAEKVVKESRQISRIC